MLDFLKLDYEYKVFGVTILNESVNNFTYKLRFPYSPRNLERETDWSDWKTNLLWPVFPTLGPRSKSQYTGGDPGLLFNFRLGLALNLNFAVKWQKKTLLYLLFIKF